MHLQADFSVAEYTSFFILSHVAKILTYDAKPFFSTKNSSQTQALVQIDEQATENKFCCSHKTHQQNQQHHLQTIAQKSS
jgi:hypothetical protein